MHELFPFDANKSVIVSFIDMYDAYLMDLGVVSLFLDHHVDGSFPTVK
jgi:hypothetical protein